MMRRPVEKSDAGCPSNFVGFPAVLCSVCLLAGCTSVPKISGVPDRSANTVGGVVPDPVFEDPEGDFQSPRIASSRPSAGIVSAPQPFAWKPLASSAGGRDIQGMTVGQGGYRSVVLGSLSGDDALAIELTERLSRHLHQNQIILGGIQATIVRSPNPDGEHAARSENHNGVYLNRQFAMQADPTTAEPEIRFLRGLLTENQPQRVIHIRTIGGEQGVIAASSGAADVARDVSRWLNFRFVDLPGKSADGTLERFLSQKGVSEIITFAVPESADSDTLWETFGDSLLNLLLDEDYETRKLARSRQNSSAADLRNEKHRFTPSSGLGSDD